MNIIEKQLKRSKIFIFFAEINWIVLRVKVYGIVLLNQYFFNTNLATQQSTLIGACKLFIYVILLFHWFMREYSSVEKLHIRFCCCFLNCALENCQFKYQRMLFSLLSYLKFIVISEILIIQFFIYMHKNHSVLDFSM